MYLIYQRLFEPEASEITKRLIRNDAVLIPTIWYLEVGKQEEHTPKWSRFFHPFWEDTLTNFYPPLLPSFPPTEKKFLL
ncbi:hypothetical protein CEXT_599301 [Caerostris extrusa]|uniref:Uncharacterized protein n=1 Tax=Caerostris extrusa TaxID=172846 RepID=A0AAV4P7N0_CAEEX|nr:hypothetical protein CEXT_599301 [Caerostris extrusa]